MSKIVILCVNYHCEAETVRFVRHLADLPEAKNLHVVVVDNESKGERADLEGEDPFTALKELSLTVDVVKSVENLGYFGGAKAGWKHYRNHEEELPDWVIVSNTDIEIIGSLQGLNAAMTIDRDILVVAPRIVSLRSGRDQNPFMKERPSSFKMQMYMRIFNSYITFAVYNLAHELKHFVKSFDPRWIRSWDALSKNSRSPMPIYAPHGAFVAFHKDYFLRGGTLDYGSFLFYEEIFVAEEVRRLRGKILYQPSMRVCHREHLTTKALSQFFPDRRLQKAQADSATYCYDHYFRNV